MTDWLTTMKPAFLHELTALDKMDVAQVMKKVELLTKDPRPDAKVKKQLKNMGGKLHRLRAGGFRILYTFAEPYVSLLSVRKRDESTYDDDIEVDFLGGDVETPDTARPQPAKAQSWESWLGPAPSVERTLPRTIDDPLLDALGVADQFRDPLRSAATEDALLACAVPQDILLKVLDAVLGTSERAVAAQPDLVLDRADDLLRFKEGDLLGFLLRLNPEQEKWVTWGVKSDHPTLLKGSPGTGKSTVALYRVRSMIEALRKKGVAEPRILFTTYTRALTRVSEQLLARLLGKDASLVDVRTADAVIREVASLSTDLALATDQDVASAAKAAIDGAGLQGNALVIASQREALRKLGIPFLLDEFRSVIEGRGLSSLASYLEAPRAGRGKALTKTQREAVWRAYEAYTAELSKKRKTTFEGIRLKARDRLRSGAVTPRYDGVLVDEVQDLPIVTVSVLVGLATTRGGIFLTADANQSIYGSGFRWKDIADGLSFQGSTGVLRANHRSTREIGEAAEAYLEAGGGSGRLDDERVSPQYVHDGALPAVRAVENDADEARLIARFFRGAARDLRLGRGGSAVLVPTNQAALRLADDLRAADIPADKIDVRDIDLAAPGVKVITQKSAKGLEFPIVAVAGFEPVTTQDDEALGEARRAAYVAMTRAMRALLVVVPSGHKSKLLDGFDDAHWNVG